MICKYLMAFSLNWTKNTFLIRSETFGSNPKRPRVDKDNTAKRFYLGNAKIVKMGKCRSWLRRVRLKIEYIRNTVGSTPTLPTNFIETDHAV